MMNLTVLHTQAAREVKETHSRTKSFISKKNKPVEERAFSRSSTQYLKSFKMKTSVAIQSIVLLACMALCTSHVIPRCRCLKTSKFVKIALIAQLKVDEPRPHCNRREVIVTLKDGSERCLDPESNFTKILLEKLNQMKNTTVSPQTTTSPATVPESS